MSRKGIKPKKLFSVLRPKLKCNRNTPQTRLKPLITRRRILSLFTFHFFTIRYSLSKNAPPAAQGTSQGENGRCVKVYVSFITHHV